MEELTDRPQPQVVVVNGVLLHDGHRLQDWRLELDHHRSLQALVAFGVLLSESLVDGSLSFQFAVSSVRVPDLPLWLFSLCALVL